MKLPGTLDPRRIRDAGARSLGVGRSAGDHDLLDDVDDGHGAHALDDGGDEYEYEYEYVYDDGDEPELVSVDDEEDAHGEDHAAGAVVVDPRIAARRDDVAQARRHRVRRRLVALAAVVLLILGAGAVTRSALLDVNEVAVVGAERSESSALATASGITPGTPLLGLDLDEALVRLRAEPWVLDATAERTWDGVVSIAVVEREPVATINAGDGGWLLVDRERRIVANQVEPPPLPIVDGVGSGAVGDDLDVGAQAALEVAAALTPGLRTRVAVVHGGDPGQVTLTLTPTGTVQFGPPTEIDERMRSLQTIFARVDLRCLATVDLRVPDAPRLTRLTACA